MKNESVRLKGFIGIKKGLGLDEISLDLSGIGGLVAFAGPNGHGKSTVLDNLHPYAMLGSRDGAIQHHTFLRDSEKEYCFRYNGDHYRTLLKIDSQSERVEGFIYKNHDTGSLVKGKISEYKAYMAELFGSANLFFNSVFCPQGSDKISDMTTGDLKKLFSEFLRLHRLVGFEDTTKQCANIRGGQIEKVLQEIEAKRAMVSDRKDAAEQLLRSQQYLQAAELKLEKLGSSIADAQLKLETEGEKVAKNTVARERIVDVESDLSRIKKEIEAQETAAEQELTDLRQKVTKIKDSITEYNDLLTNEPEIRQAAEKEKELAVQVETSNTDMLKAWEGYSAAKERLQAKEKERDDVLARAKTVKNDLQAKELQHQIKTAEEKMADLEKKDPACTSTTCSFIVGALLAQKALPEIKTHLAELNEIAAKVLSQCETTLRSIEAEIKSFRPAADAKKKEYDDLKARLGELQKAHKAQKDLAAELPRVEVAAAKKEELEKQHAELMQKGISKKEAMAAAAKMNATRVKNLEAKIADIRSTIDHAAEVAVSETKETIGDFKQQITTAEIEAGRLKSVISAFERDVLELQEAEKALAELEIEQKRLSKERGVFAYIKDACSKDGLRALEIDAVTPAINEYANELLRKAEWNEMVKLITQDPNGREILDLLIIDRDGEETLLSNRSGGEKVWPLKTIRLAMARINNERSGRNFRTLLADEEDGPLSTENALRFVSLYRSIITPHPESGIKTFDDCYYISHKEACVAMADHVLTFKRGGVEVN